MKSQTFSPIMHIKRRRIFTFLLLSVSILTMAMHCEPEPIPYYPIPELENVKAYVAITPQKDVYKVGDTIICTLRVDRKDWNNWVDFDKAIFNEFLLFSYDGDDSKPLDLIPERSSMPSKATKLPDGESYIQQITYYKLTSAKTYVLGAFTLDKQLNTYQNFQYWGINYEDITNDKWYLAEVPIFFINSGKRYLELKVEDKPY